MRFCRDNVIVLSAVRIPLYVCFVASLGPKFSYHENNGEKDDVFNYLVVFEKLKEKVMDFVSGNTLDREREKFMKKCRGSGFRERATVPSSAQKFIKLQMERTKIFLSRHPDVKVFPADKGGKVVITDHGMYVEKMRMYLALNVKSGIYFHCQGLTISYVKKICEEKYENLMNMVNEVFGADWTLGLKETVEKIVREPFVISRIYGLFKVHKEGYPVRPIVSATNCMGEPLAKWIRERLAVIAKHVGKHQVKDAMELFEALNGKELNSGRHVLVTFDFDSMFTNVPFQRTKDVIRKFYYLIEKETSMPVDLFMECLSFLVEGCSYFTFGGEVYVQSEGLAMGNSLSQILAEITTSCLLSEAVSKFSGDEVSFIYKYVDDLVAAVDVDCIELVKDAIEKSHGGMKLKLEMEDEKREVSYLQVKIGRDVTRRNVLYFKWTQKEFSAKRILDYHSFHPMKMKISFVREFVRNALKLTSTQFWNLSVNALKKTLFRSNYPYYFVWERIGEVKCELEGKVSSNTRDKDKVVKKFISCPYRPGSVEFLRRVVKKSNLYDVSISPTMCNNNRKMVFSNLKDKRDIVKLVNSSFVVRCKSCEFDDRLFACEYDIETTLKLTLFDCSSKLYKHCEGTGHKIDECVRQRDIVQYRNKSGLRYAKKVM